MSFSVSSSLFLSLPSSNSDRRKKSRESGRGSERGEGRCYYTGRTLSLLTLFSFRSVLVPSFLQSRSFAHSLSFFAPWTTFAFPQCYLCILQLQGALREQYFIFNYHCMFFSSIFFSSKFFLFFLLITSKI